MLLYQLQELVCVADSDLKQSLGTRELKIKLRIRGPDQVEVLGCDSRDELLTVQSWLVEVKDEQQKSNDILNDFVVFEVCRSSLEVALQEVQQCRQQVDVVLVALEALDYFLDQNDHELRDAFKHLLVE
jgi:hypothetical protein